MFTKAVNLVLKYKIERVRAFENWRNDNQTIGKKNYKKRFTITKVASSIWDFGRITYELRNL